MHHVRAFGSIRRRLAYPRLQKHTFELYSQHTGFSSIFSRYAHFGGVRKVGDVDISVKNTKKSFNPRRRSNSLRQNLQLNPRNEAVHEPKAAESARTQNVGRLPEEKSDVRGFHPVLIVDVANIVGVIQTDKWFSHVVAGRDLHRDLQKALKQDQARTTAQQDESEIVPELEVVLVFEKQFRTGVKEGIATNDKVWLRAVHATNTSRLVPNAGDDTIVSQAEWAREVGQEVTIVTNDKQLGKRLRSFGCRILSSDEFAQLMSKKSLSNIDYKEPFLERLQKMLAECAD
ncbi:hypothetical protein LTS08_004787 [Lithohypha guttulata]|nr:hypothetical protein LTS08_004787 [Lithohypha guttulata]